MKHILLLSIAILSASALVSAQHKQNVETMKNDGQVLKTVIKVPTLVCNSCVTTVTKALKKVEGVTAAKVNLKAKTATVSYASTKVTLRTLEQAIADAGYDANELKRNPEAYDKLDACCKADPKK